MTYFCFTTALRLDHVYLEAVLLLNPWYTGGLFHCYILDESICPFRGVGSILLLLFYF